MFPEFLKECYQSYFFLIIAFGLSCAFIIVNLSYLKNPDPEKLSAYGVDSGHSKTQEWNLM